VRFVVASASPRRHELLAALGLVFEVRPAAIDEAAVADDLPPADAVLAIAIAKAEAVPCDDALLLTADTVVVLDGRILGKPVSPAEARRMLAALRARTHRVVTGVCLVAPDARRTAVVESEVRMRAYGTDEVEAYVAAGGGLDKAGAYGIQDEPLRPVEAIAGCWCNVMGLPLWTTWGLLRAAGLLAPRTPEEPFARCAACPRKADVS
jgi:septum formation protein